MSAFGTEKFQTTSLRLGMPSAFQNAYARNGPPEQYAVVPQRGEPDLPVGHDFQSHWHEQKKRDAHYMANAKVHSTHMMYKRSNSSPHGYYGMPKPVLSQRTFANPSMGALQSGNPTREDYSDAPWHFSDAHGLRGGSVLMKDYGRLVGGTLRSAQGQAYGISLLHRRIAELDAINALKATLTTNEPQINGEAATTGALGADMVPLKSFPSSTSGFTQVPQRAFPGAQPSPSQGLAQVPQIELSQLLQSILDNLDEGENVSGGRLTYQDSVRAFALIVRLATTGSADDIQDVLTFVIGTSAEDGILQKLDEITFDPGEAGRDPSVKNLNLYLSLKDFWTRIRNYLMEMVKTVGQPYKSRQLASQTWIKTLQFTKSFRGKMPQEFLNPEDVQQAIDDAATAPFSDEDRGWRGVSTSKSSSSSSSAPTLPPRRGRVPLRREDSQHGYTGTGGAQFDADDRQRFAYASGEFPTGGRGVEESEGSMRTAMDGNEEVEDEISEGEEEYEENALGTNPSNAGPRLVSRRDEVSGEYDVAPPKEKAAPSSIVGKAPIISRNDISASLGRAGLIGVIERINAHYKNALPDGKGKLNYNRGSTAKSIRLNIIRRLQL